MKKRIEFLILLIAFALPALGQDVSVTAKMDSVQIMIGEQTDLVIQVKLDAKKQAQLPFYNDTIVKGVEVLDMTLDTVYSDNHARMTLTQRYKITSFESELYVIPPVEVEVEGEVFKTEPLALKVETFPDLEEANPEEFFGVKDIMTPPFVWGDWKMFFGSLGLIGPMVFLLIFLIMRLADNKPIIRRIKLTPETPPHDTALQQIEEIKGRKSWQTAGPKAYYTELTNVLRNYMYKRFGFNALEMTSSEIIEELEKIEQKDIDELRALFSTADLVKFAKHNPMINENDANLVNAIDFINETKLVPDPEAKPEPTEKVIVEKRSLRTKILLSLGALIALAITIGCIVYIVTEGADLLRTLF